MKETDLTIGMPCYDDYDGAYFTIQALRMYHPRVKTLIIDNNPESPSGKETKKLCDWTKTKYVPFTDFVGTFAKDKVFLHSETKYTLCCDCHILFKPTSIFNLIKYYENNPETDDLIQGTLVYDDLGNYSTHFNMQNEDGSPRWSTGMLGQWAKDDRGAEDKSEPFEIECQGMGVFSCRTESWLGFNKHMHGFGGEEGYIQEKYRRAGRKTLCLPQLRWVHRFGRPLGIPYPNIWEERLRNYLIGHREFGLDEKPMFEHFCTILGREKVIALANKYKDFDPLS